MPKLASLHSSRFARPVHAAAAMALCTSVAAPAFAKPALDMGPYIPFCDAESAIVRLRTTEPTRATLSVRGPGGTERSLPSTGARFHEFRLRDLKAGTAYPYEVLIDGAFAARGTLTTAPVDGSKPWSFVLYGDSRTDHAAHQSVAQAIDQVPGQFLLHTGDVVSRGDDDEAWRRFFAIEAGLLRDRPLFVTLGNHDMSGRWKRTREDYQRLFGRPSGRTYFSFRWGNVRFYVLDTMDSFSGAQGEWFRKMLESNREEAGVEHRFVSLHHGPFSSGPHGPNERFIDDGLLDALRDGGVELVMSGHDHLYERGEVGALKYIVSGGAGAPLYEASRPERPSKRLSVHHFVHVLVEGARVTTTTRDAAGRIIERCSFESGEAWSCDPQVVAPLYRGTPAMPSRSRTRCGCSVPGHTDGQEPGWWIAALWGLVWAFRRRRASARNAAS
ncbi:MAG: metallophosphoesterase family protein [Myxococcota bacterium]